ncbi:MAG: hypothetical protein AABZ14_07060 [Candidatus Margulisiibacteriota bacterium]
MGAEHVKSVNKAGEHKSDNNSGLPMNILNKAEKQAFDKNNSGSAISRLATSMDRIVPPDGEWAAKHEGFITIKNYSPVAIDIESRYDKTYLRYVDVRNLARSILKLVEENKGKLNDRTASPELMRIRNAVLEKGIKIGADRELGSENDVKNVFDFYKVMDLRGEVFMEYRPYDDDPNAKEKTVFINSTTLDNLLKLYNQFNKKHPN